MSIKSKASAFSEGQDELLKVLDETISFYSAAKRRIVAGSVHIGTSEISISSLLCR